MLSLKLKVSNYPTWSRATANHQLKKKREKNKTGTKNSNKFQKYFSQHKLNSIFIGCLLNLKRKKTTSLPSSHFEDDHFHEKLLLSKIKEWGKCQSNTQSGCLQLRRKKNVWLFQVFLDQSNWNSLTLCIKYLHT